MKTIRHIKTIAFATLVLLAAIGCDSKTLEDKAEEVSKEMMGVALAIDEERDLMIIAIEAEQKSISREICQLDDEFEEMEEDISDEANDNYKEMKNTLEKAADDLKNQLERIDGTSIDAWENTKDDLSDALNDTKDALDDTREDIKDFFSREK